MATSSEAPREEVAAYPPDLYRTDRVAPHITGFDQIGDNQVAFYQEYGFLAVEQAFTPEDVRVTLDAFLDFIASNPRHGVEFEKSAQAHVRKLPATDRQQYIRKFGTFLQYSDDPRLRILLEHGGLQQAVTRLLGGATPQLFTHQAFFKPPGGREKPWHQDHAYFTVPLGTPIVGVWIALDEATVENGCMHVIPGSHREGPVVHFKRRDWQICDTQVEVGRDTVVPLKSGGCLFFDGMVHHGTPPNLSSKLRRSVQFHFVPNDAKLTDDEERVAIWGGDAQGLEC